MRVMVEGLVTWAGINPWTNKETGEIKEFGKVKVLDNETGEAIEFALNDNALFNSIVPETKQRFEVSITKGFGGKLQFKVMSVIQPDKKTSVA